MTRLIDRLRTDFGPSFLITLAPVLTALIPGMKHLSGFSYRSLEELRGRDIAWYNAQFYNGWAAAQDPAYYQAAILRGGWDPRRVVLGVLSSPDNGHGYIDIPQLAAVVGNLRGWCALRPGEGGREAFGGVMEWEYFNSQPGGYKAPWEWAAAVGGMLASPLHLAHVQQAADTPSVRPDMPFPAEKVKQLTELGFSDQQALYALNVTEGNVEHAAGLLFGG